LLFILRNIENKTGFAVGVKSKVQKQLMVDKIIENKGLSAVNQLLAQAEGTQRLKAHIQKTLNSRSSSKRLVLCVLPGF
jgi:hypothetical protein